MFFNCKISIFFVCFLIVFPSQSLQQRKNNKYSYTTQHEEEKSTQNRPGTHWKSIGIIILGVLIFAAICYGSNCLYLCKMTICKGSERHYTKMDMTSQV